MPEPAGGEKRLEGRKKHLSILSQIREFIFGIQDALISMIGLLCGVKTATQDAETVVIAGAAAAFTGALSMATGSYLSSKAQKEIFEKELSEQKHFVEDSPHLAKEGLLDALSEEGMSRQSAYRVVKFIAKEKQVFVRTFQEKVLGLGSADITNPIRGAFVMYASFMIGAFLPVIPYIVMPLDHAFFVSVAVVGLSLFLVGAFKNKLADKNIFAGGFEFLCVALGSSLLGWIVGKFFEKVAL